VIGTSGRTLDHLRGNCRCAACRSGPDGRTRCSTRLRARCRRILPSHRESTEPRFFPRRCPAATIADRRRDNVISRSTAARLSRRDRARDTMPIRRSNRRGARCWIAAATAP
jgi:hypothetical protein